MATVSNRHNAGSNGRTFGETQSPSGNGQGRALMNADALSLGVVHRSDHGRIGRIDLDHFDAVTKARRTDSLAYLVARERADHSRLARFGLLQFRLLSCKVQRFHHHRLAGLPRPSRNLDAGITDQGLRLPGCLAIEIEVEPATVYPVAEPVCLGHGQVIGIDVDADGANLQ